MPRSRGAYPAVRRPKRETMWFAGPDETTATTVIAGAADLQSSLNAAALALRPFTIIRTVGMLLVQSDQIAANELVSGAYGLAVVSDQASTVGLTAVPTPITEEGSDLWFLYQFGFWSWRFNSSGAQGPGVFQFDSRAMRKVEDGQDIVSVFENGDGSFGIQYLARFRMLVKLH